MPNKDNTPRMRYSDTNGYSSRHRGNQRQGYTHQGPGENYYMQRNNQYEQNRRPQQKSQFNDNIHYGGGKSKEGQLVNSLINFLHNYQYN